MNEEMSKEQKEEEEKWKQDSDARTLKDAEEIKKDPKRMKGVEEWLKHEKKALSMMDKMFPSMMGKDEKE